MIADGYTDDYRYFQLHLTFLSILGLINFIGRVMVLLFDVPNENQKNNCYLESGECALFCLIISWGRGLMSSNH